MAAAFSRLQLAAALLEYDNDSEDPNVPKRSAHESAIFANFRRYLPSTIPRKGDYLGVPLPSDGANTRKAHSIVDHRQSKASAISISTLQNPFSRDDHMEQEDESGEDLEVDLASWGLEAFIPKDKTGKGSRNVKGKTKPAEHLAPHSVSSVPSHHPLTSREDTITVPRRALGASRSMSVGGNLEYFGTEGRESLAKRRRSLAVPGGALAADTPPQRRRASSYTPLSTTPALSSELVPFPTTSLSAFANKEDVSFRPTSFPNQLEPTSIHGRATSHSSNMNLEPFPRNPEGIDHPIPRISSHAINTPPPLDDNPFALHPPTHTSRFDPKAASYPRTISNASMGSRPQIEHDAASSGPAPNDRERRYTTTLELLRPKVLVMPSPLQPVSTPILPPANNVRDGFQLSTDGPPLPPGARSAHRSSFSLSTSEPPAVASNSFIPNPLGSLSLSQMTFRNTLGAGAEGDGYMSADLPRATEDGQQITLDDDGLDQPQTSVILDMDNVKGARPAGKLYGKSLIDDLEDRKAKMRSKQRVFTGDERPSMMARGTLQRSSTLIDPVTLQSRLPSQHTASHGLGEPQEILRRRNSASIKPLLNFEEDNKTPGPRLTAARSVFGVDTLWEREMVKLREIEAQEKADEEERRKEVVEDDDGKKKKKKKKKQKRRVENQATPESGAELRAVKPPPPPRISMEPPILPDIQRAPRRAQPQISDNNSDSDGSVEPRPGAHYSQHPDPNWHAISSDEDGPRQTTETGHRHPQNRTRHVHATYDQSDDDDVPLSVAVPRVSNQASSWHSGKPDSDDERLLSTLHPKKQNIPLPDNSREGDDDDRPLGLRVSRMSSQLGGDDDDQPLAYHPQQQRKTQYQMLAQQQQMLLQAQMQHSMYFPAAPPLMGTPFFAPPTMPMMMQPPVPSPVQDEVKFGRVDRWRHNVAVEGDHP